jgi:hypothetical protein
MRKSRKIRRTLRKNLKNKKSHRMRGGGSCLSKTASTAQGGVTGGVTGGVAGGVTGCQGYVSPFPPEVNCEKYPILYGIVVGPDGRHYVESFTRQLSSSSTGTRGQVYQSADSPPVLLQVTTDSKKMSQGAATAIPRPIAFIDYLLSGYEAEKDDFNPTVLSENRYLYSSREDADTSLHQLMRPAASRCAALRPTVSPTVSDRAKAFLQQDTLPVSQSQRMDAIAHAGLNRSLIRGLVQDMPRSRPDDADRASQSMMRVPPSKSKYGHQSGWADSPKSGWHRRGM